MEAYYKPCSPLPAGPQETAEAFRSCMQRSTRPGECPRDRLCALYVRGGHVERLTFGLRQEAPRQTHSGSPRL